MRILLINPRISGERRYSKFSDVGSYLPPYGLLTLGAILEKNGFIVKIVDADRRIPLSLDEVVKTIRRFSPHAIGMTAYSIASDKIPIIAKKIKENFNVPIVVGGPHVTTFAEDLAQCPFIDFLVVGEGEITSVELFRAIKRNSGYKDIKGIIYRENDSIIKNPPREFIKDLDILPFPALHLIDNIEEYAPTPLMYKKRPCFMLTTSRGCPFQCIFCNPIWSRRYRANSAEYVVELMEYCVKKHGFREIMFYEDTFCLDKERIFKICKLLRQRNIKVIWSCSSHVNSLTKEMLFEMKKAGCWLISIGIESGNQGVIDFVKKGLKLERVRQVADWAEQAGIQLRGNFILGHPIDTKKTIKQTIDFAKSLPLHTISVTILQLLPGSEVRKIAHKYGTVDYDLTLGTGYPGDHLSFVPFGLTKEYLKSSQKKAYREFFLRPRQIWRLIRSIDSWEDIRKYFLLFRTFIKLMLSK